jgi:hypothetical protein
MVRGVQRADSAGGGRGRDGSCGVEGGAAVAVVAEERSHQCLCGVCGGWVVQLHLPALQRNGCQMTRGMCECPHALVSEDMACVLGAFELLQCKTGCACGRIVRDRGAGWCRQCMGRQMLQNPAETLLRCQQQLL